MDYNPIEIEKKWQAYWAKEKPFKAANNSDKPKYYVLDMFPYPSGAGLHVGHPLGYIASDIIARYKRLQGFNVLHPMGYDSFGLPAEQYAIQTGQHPAVTTEENIARYRQQLDKIGFSFDWDREVRTSSPDYYKWTQWIFIKLFHSWYNTKTDKAEPIKTLIQEFEANGYSGSADNPLTGGIEKEVTPFTAQEWKEFEEQKKRDILMTFRLAYLDYTWVNWCPALGTVLANDEVKDGVSERGGHPVERKQMRQWSLRITAYAERLLNGLDALDWSESIKEAQRNWIGKSKGCSIQFHLSGGEVIEVFTTRPDTIFGASYLTLAPEHELVAKITTDAHREKVEAYVTYAKNRSERERQADVKNITGEFTGAYALHPFTGEKIPVWIGDYVLAGYGTGAVMAVPAHDERDFAFAKHFEKEMTALLGHSPIKVVVEPHSPSPEERAWGEAAYGEKSGKLINSDFLNGLDVKEAIGAAIAEMEKRGIGKGKVNYRLRDAIFGRQRYWGEPIPVYYKNDTPYTVDEEDLPINLPEVDKFLPTEDGEPPLARATDWKYRGQYEFEKTTMPGWAGSSWYYLRYMDPNNPNAIADRSALDYWKEVDLYIGGAEHATGHLLYFRFWTKFLKDLGYISIEEPAKKLINQGMILGRSALAYRINLDFNIDCIDDNGKYLGKYNYELRKPESNYTSFKKEIFISKKYVSIGQENFGYPILNDEIKTAINQKIREEFLKQIKFGEVTLGNRTYQFNDIEIVFEHFPISRINVDINDINESDDSIINLKNRILVSDYCFCEENEQFTTVREVEKMSKSKYNVVSPDEICNEYGADTLRLYEMFLGPLEDHKPWNTNGIEGTSRFLKKLWRLFHVEGDFAVSNDAATPAELKALHKCLKRVYEDIERYSFNTVVSTFMIAVNELADLKCNKCEILEPLLIVLSPYAPHIAEELWSKLGHSESVTYAKLPTFNEAHLVENSFNYPVSFNGKMRFQLELPANLSVPEIEKEVMSREETQKWLEGKAPKKVIIVPKRIVNIVV
ncbi:MAG: leucine--tRNA ligase [Flavobacteriales bacterium]